MLDTPANVPATVTVVFPRSDSGVLGTSVYAISVALASLSLAEYGDEVGRLGAHIVHSAAIADFTGGGSPTNDSELQALAEQVATDFYLWRLASVNAKYRGLLPWTCDAMHDVEYLHGATIVTSVFASRWEPDFGNLKHAGTNGSSDIPVAGGSGITHVNGNTGPMVRVGLGRSGTGPNLGATAAAWSATVEYQPGDVVSHSGSTYYCILENINQTPPSATYWTVTTEDLIVANLPDASDANRGIVNRYNQKFGNDDGAYIGKWFACPVYGQQFIIPKANPFYSPTTGLNTINAVDIVGTVPYSSYGDDGFTIYNYITNPSSVVVSYEYVTFSCAIDVFSGSNTYSLGDKVQYLGRLYTYINATPSGVSPAFPTYWAEWNYPVSPATTMKGFYSHGFVAAEHGYLARESGSGNWRLGTSGTIFGLNWGDGILLGGTPAVPGTSITPGTLPTSVLAPSFYLPAENAGTVMEAENKEGSTVSAGMVVTTHSSGTGFVLADATDIGKSVTGIARESIANTVSGEIQSEGLITLADWTAATGSATLAAKANYFSDPANPGKLTTTAPSTTGHVSQLVGVAVSDDTMDLILSPPILL